jgi:hypothetical protein
MLPLPGAARMPAGPAESFALPVSLPWARFLLLVGAMPQTVTTRRCKMRDLRLVDPIYRVDHR